MCPALFLCHRLRSCLQQNRVSYNQSGQRRAKHGTHTRTPVRQRRTHIILKFGFANQCSVVYVGCVHVCVCVNEANECERCYVSMSAILWLWMGPTIQRCQYGRVRRLRDDTLFCALLYWRRPCCFSCMSFRTVCNHIMGSGTSCNVLFLYICFVKVKNDIILCQFQIFHFNSDFTPIWTFPNVNQLQSQLPKTNWEKFNWKWIFTFENVSRRQRWRSWKISTLENAMQCYA